MTNLNDLKRDLVPANSDALEDDAVAKRDPERGDAESPFGHEPEEPPASVDDLLKDVGLPDPKVPT